MASVLRAGAMLARPSVATAAHGALARVGAVSTQQVRFFNLHEYQSKDLMEKYSVNVQKFRTATNAEDAVAFAHELGKYLHMGYKYIRKI